MGLGDEYYEQRHAKCREIEDQLKAENFALKEQNEKLRELVREATNLIANNLDCECEFVSDWLARASNVILKAKQLTDEGGVSETDKSYLLQSRTALAQSLWKYLSHLRSL